MKNIKEISDREIHQEIYKYLLQVEKRTESTKKWVMFFGIIAIIAIVITVMHLITGMPII